MREYEITKGTILRFLKDDYDQFQKDKRYVVASYSEEYDCVNFISSECEWGVMVSIDDAYELFDLDKYEHCVPSSMVDLMRQVSLYEYQENYYGTDYIAPEEPSAYEIESLLSAVRDYTFYVSKLLKI